MPGLKDLLRKKDKIVQEAQPSNNLTAHEFKFIRSTTESEEIIEPPSFPDDEGSQAKSKTKSERRRTLGFRHHSSSSITKDDSNTATDSSPQQLKPRPKEERRLSSRLHLGRDRLSRSISRDTSVNLPDDLPDAPEAIVTTTGQVGSHGEDARDARENQEAQWEKRATILAMHNPILDGPLEQESKRSDRSRSSSVSDVKGDVNIQEAIRLHEEGNLTESTRMFGQLAEPHGANNALAQVLYGLALRHGWGVPVEPEKAIRFLSLAASNSASVEEQALASGMRKGGAAKGELVLAIFELANCFRHGWGVKKDPVAARQYYETAANLGDTDAMDEAAWCYLEGFGGSKDKFKAAQYLRLAEQKGSKSVGNSWIWKEKYNPK